MKTIWVHVNDKTVPTEECCGSLRTDKNFDSSKIRDMLCREVSHEIGRNSNTNYSKKTECHTLYFHCPIKKCPMQWKVTVYPSSNKQTRVCMERSEGEHDHDESERCKSLSHNARSFIHANSNCHVVTLFNEIQKRKLNNDMNPSELKKKISYSKWYSKRKEKERNKEKDGDSLEDLKQFLDSQKIDIRHINIEYFNEDVKFGTVLAQRHRCISHDCSRTADFNHCTLISQCSKKIIQSLKDSHRQFQLEIDFSKGFFKGDKLQVGCIGISDVHHVFWPMLFIVCDAENHINALRCIESALQIFAQCSIDNVRYLLKDGGTAIQSAYEEVNEREKNVTSCRCMAHMFRAGFTRGGGYQ